MLLLALFPGADSENHVCEAAPSMKTKLVLRKNVGCDILKEMHGSSVKQEIFTKLVGKLSA